MKHISIIVPAGEFVLGSVEGPYKLFSQVNAFLRDKGRPDLFKIDLVGIDHEACINGVLFRLQMTRTIENKFHTDLVIIPAPHGAIVESIELNKKLIPWIIEKYKGGAEIASLCMGAFILAATGLIDGKKCATHWIAADELRRSFPKVQVVTEKVITDEQGIYSSGGAYSYLNLILYLIEKYTGREMAVLIAKIFEIEIDRGNQSQFIIFRGQKSHHDIPIRKAQEYIEQNYQQKITVDQLASMFALSRRNLERRFKKATSNTAVEYIQRVKIEAAKNSLESSRENVNEVMYKVGYSDSKAFRDTFKKITGLSPLQYRAKYNRDSLVL